MYLTGRRKRNASSTSGEASLPDMDLNPSPENRNLNLTLGLLSDSAEIAKCFLFVDENWKTSTGG